MLFVSSDVKRTLGKSHWVLYLQLKQLYLPLKIYI